MDHRFGFRSLTTYHLLYPPFINDKERHREPFPWLENGRASFYLMDHVSISAPEVSKTKQSLTSSSFTLSENYLYVSPCLYVFVLCDDLEVSIIFHRQGLNDHHNKKMAS